MYCPPKIVPVFVDQWSGKEWHGNGIRKVPLTGEKIRKYAKFRNPMNHVTVCMKREVLLGVGNYENVLWHEDYYLWIKMLISGYKLQNLPEVSVHVRAGSFTSRRSGLKYLQSEIAFIQKCYELGFRYISETLF